MYIRCLFIFIFPLASTLYAQPGRVVYRSSETPSVQLKWYSPDLVYPEGTNIYRMDADEIIWKKLNAAPIKRGKQPLPDQIKRDPVMGEMVKAMATMQQQDIQGMMLLTLMLKSFESQPFAEHLGIYFQDTTTEKGKRYKYKVTVLHNGHETELDETDFITAGKTASLLPPQDITFFMRKRSVRLKWMPEDSRYYAVNIYRQDSLQGPYEKINQLPVMVSQQNQSDEKKYPEYFFEDQDIREKNTYNYQLKAVDFFGEESAPSAAITVRFHDQTPPSPPVNVTGRWYKDKGIQLHWKNSSDEPVSLHIYRSLHKDTLYQRINLLALTNTDTSHTDPVQEKGYYYYYVSVTDLDGNESVSGKTLVEVPDAFPPSIPDGLLAISDTGKVILSWNPSPEKDVIGYYVYRATDNDSAVSYVVVNARPVNHTMLMDDLPVNLDDHIFYAVQSVDSMYNRSKLSLPVRVRLPDVTAPPPPVVKNIRMEAHGLVIEWLPSVAADLGGYNVYRIQARDSTEQRINEQLISAAHTSWYDSLLTPGVEYGFFLRAADRSGNLSAISNIFPSAMPQSKSEKALHDVEIRYHKRRNTVTLKWQGPSSDGLLGYMIYSREAREEPTAMTALIDETEHEVRIKTNRIELQVRAYYENGASVKSSWLAVR